MLSSIISIIALVIGFSLGQLGDFFKNKKENRKKYNILLFNLLELRHMSILEIYGYQDIINAYMERMKVKFYELYHSNEIPELSASENDLKTALSLGEKGLKDQLLENPDNIKKYWNIENKITELIPSISEINPLFAYYLNNTFSLTGRMKSEELDLTKYGCEGNNPFDVTELTKKKGFENFIPDLDSHILEVMKKCKKIDKEEIKDILDNREIDIDIDKIDDLLDEYIDVIKKQIIENR